MLCQCGVELRGSEDQDPWECANCKLMVGRLRRMPTAELYRRKVTTVSDLPFESILFKAVREAVSKGRDVDFVKPPLLLSYQKRLRNEMVDCGNVLLDELRHCGWKLLDTPEGYAIDYL